MTKPGLCVLVLVAMAGCGGGADEPDGGMPGSDVGAPSDVPVLDGGASDGGTEPDAPVIAEAGSDAPTVDAGSCESAAVDYSCTGPADCIGGTCIAGLCLGPARDPDRWAACGDGACGDCESAEVCPADCGGSIVRTALPTFDPDTTFTLKLHGLAVTTEGSIEDRTYGDAVPEGELEAYLRMFAPGLPDGLEEPDAPNQLVAAEYYGVHPADWLTTDQIAEIESYPLDTELSLHRYALIVALFIRHRFELSGASHVAIVCHSMGCHVTRYIVEHDMLGLASEGRIARVMMQGGVLGGAALAELFDNPTLREYAMSQPVATTDFIHMHPDYVADVVARWDHQRHEANNPTWAGIYVHSIAGTDPVAAGSTGLIRPLDIINPDNLANDAILFDVDTYFHAMAEGNRLVTPSGERISPSVSYVNRSHLRIEPSESAGAITAAGLYHRRRVTITLRSVTLRDDHERDGPLDVSTYGAPPADLVPEVEVTYDSFTTPTFGVAATVNERTLGDRSAALLQMNEGTQAFSEILFEGPVFDAQTHVHLTLDLREVDSYGRFGITELPAGDGSSLATFDDEVALVPGTFVVEGEDLDATIEVAIRDVY